MTPANGRVAALALAGKVEAERFTQGSPARVAVPVADLCPAPGKRRDRQVIWGETVMVYEDRDGWSFVQADKDGYVGYLRSTSLAAPRAATHRVSTPATHIYEGESFKSSDLAHLSFGARVTVTAELHKMWETPEGFIPKKHLRPLDRPFTDPATVAQLFFGMPYLWGGNSALGIDCSGLVQVALTGCDIACPGDSDLQRAALGFDLPDDSPRQRGDLYFWKGHVGMLVDPDTLLHANAHHMAVSYEPIGAAILRICSQGDGEVLTHKRL